jgi:cytochrome c553
MKIGSQHTPDRLQEVMMILRRRIGRAAIGLLTSGFCLVAASNICVAGDVKAGHTKALMCQACHGMDGLSKTPDAPNIAGQIESYITLQLQAFKSGARKNDAMSVVVQPLSDADIDDLAAYFSAIEISVVKIPER